MEKQIKLKEKASFGAAVLVQNMVFGFVTAYLLIFYTDILGLSAAAVGTLFFVARIWDGINDPIMGIICDKTRTRWGKFRPYFLISPILIGLTTILIFRDPGLKGSALLIYAYVTYIAWGMAFTVTDIPIWSMTSVMSTNPKERVGLISVGKLMGIVGLVVIMGAGIQIVNALGYGDAKTGYANTAMFIGILAAVLMTGMFFFTKERAEYSKEAPNVKESLKVLKSNKPLLIIIGSFMVTNMVYSVMQGINIYFATYNMGNPDFMTTMTMVPFPFMVLGIIITPMLTKVMDKKNIIIYSSIINGLLGIAFYFVGYGSIPVVLGIYSVRSLLMGVAMITLTTMITDTIDYAEHAFGLRLEGIAFSMQSFSIKFASGIGGLLSGFFLTAIHYVPNVVQTPQTLSGLFMFLSLFPAVASFISAGIAYAYPLSDKRCIEIANELRGKKGEEVLLQNV